MLKSQLFDFDLPKHLGDCNSNELLEYLRKYAEALVNTPVGSNGELKAQAELLNIASELNRCLFYEDLDIHPVHHYPGGDIVFIEGEPLELDEEP